MSTARGNTKRDRRPAHMNSFAFKHNTGSKKTARIARLPIHTMCLPCTKVILWKKKYRKYKPRTKPGRCNKCQKKNVLAAYHVMCRGCARKNNVCAKCNTELTDDNRPEENEDGSVVLDDEDFEDQQRAQARPGDRRGLQMSQDSKSSGSTKRSKKKKDKKKSHKKAKEAAPVRKLRKGDEVEFLNAATSQPMVAGKVVAVYGARATITLDWVMADGKPAMAFVGLDTIRRKGETAPVLPPPSNGSDDEASEREESDESTHRTAQGSVKNSFKDIIPKSRRKDLRFQQKHMQRARLPPRSKRS